MAVIVSVPESPLGEAALERAVAEATLRGVPVVVVANVAMPRSESGAETYQAQRKEVEAEVDDLVGSLADQGVPVSAYIPAAPASAADAVLQAAGEHEAELIVIGIRRRSPVGKALLGSAAQDILLAADCPVLGVKLAAEDEEGS